MRMVVFINSPGILNYNSLRMGFASPKEKGMEEQLRDTEEDCKVKKRFPIREGVSKKRRAG